MLFKRYLVYLLFNVEIYFIRNVFVESNLFVFEFMNYDKK